MFRYRISFLVVLPAMLVAAFVYSGCRRGTQDEDGPVYLNWSPEAEYIGRDACRDCHLENYTTFVQSQMGRSWKRAKRSLSDADWDDPEPVYSPGRDLYYQPFAVGEDLFVREYRLSGADTVHNRVEQIDYIVGSGHHTNSHIREVNGYLYQVPVTYYTQDGEWHLPPGFQSVNSRFDRPIPPECMTCHNGMSPHVSGSENRFESVASGIGCERCHGPGSVHAEAIRAGNVVNINEEIDYTIVHPGKLPSERVWDVCARCHMQAVDVFKPGIMPDDFRPGRRLVDYQNVLWPRRPDSVEVFNMASHPDRLAMSACYQASMDPTRDLPDITCLTCHNPHLDVKAKAAFEYNAPCRACHAIPGVPACAEDLQARELVDDDCSSCHLPTSGTDDIPHVRITDHFIRVPGRRGGAARGDADSLAIIRMASLVDKNPTPLDLARGYLAYYERITNRPEALALARAELRQARESGLEDGLDQARIWLWYLLEDYGAIRRHVSGSDPQVPDDAWSQLRIGEAFRASGEWGRAIGFLQRAVELAPEHLRFLDRLATTYTALGEYEEALSTFDSILIANPTYGDALNNRGFAYLSQGRLDEAEADFKEAIRLDPDAATPIGNLASIYVNTGRGDLARPLIARLLSIDPDNPDYRRLLQAALDG